MLGYDLILAIKGTKNSRDGKSHSLSTLALIGSSDTDDKEDNRKDNCNARDHHDEVSTEIRRAVKMTANA